LTKSAVSNVSLCIYECQSNSVLERWTFDLQHFPSIPKKDRDIPFSDDQVTSVTATAAAKATGKPISDQDDDDDALSNKISIVDLEASFRATLSRLNATVPRLKPLPEPPQGPECSFTLTIEILPNADRPVGRLEREERKWVAAEPEVNANAQPLSPTAELEKRSISNAGKGTTHPIRRLANGPLYLELYVEESAAKSKYDMLHDRNSAKRAAEMSYGAGTEKFDPVHGYDDVEGTDLNRKPGDGIGSDYNRGF
jgi:hypothetical protein